MATPRRSRMYRTRLGKSLALTDRDLEIFRTLCRYRYLGSTYLHAFAGGQSTTRFKERLGDLFHEGYIDRPAKQWEFANARHLPAVYEIGGRALRILAESGIATNETVTTLGSGPTRQFAHAVLVCECMASFELAVRTIPNLRFIPWSEIHARMIERLGTDERRPTQTTNAIIPDGFFGLEYCPAGKKLYRFFALELDRGTMPITRNDSKQTSILEKLRTYQQIVRNGLQREQWGVPNLIVLVVTITEERKSDMLRTCAVLGTAPQILFKALGDWQHKPDVDLLAAAWERSALPPMSIIAAD